MKQRIYENKWIHFLLLTILLSIIPYSFEQETTLFSSDFIIRGIFYTSFSSLQPFIQFTTLSLIRLVNYILIIIPCLYFTYRRIYRFEGESLEALGAITSVLTFIVIIILDPQALVSNYQMDTSPTPTPNFSFLPTFALLLLLVHVFIPIVRERLAIPTSLNKSSGNGLLSKLKSIIPSTAFGWIMLMIILLPSIMYIQLSPLTLRRVDVSVEIFSSLFSIRYNPIIGGTSFEGSISFFLGGFQFIQPIIQSGIWSFSYIFIFILYLYGRIQKKIIVIAALISLIPSLFVTMLSVVSNFLLLSNTIAFPLPLIQIISILVLRRTEKVRYLEESGESDALEGEIKVPFSYMLRSLFKGRKRHVQLEVIDEYKTSGVEDKSEREFSKHD